MTCSVCNGPVKTPGARRCKSCSTKALNSPECREKRLAGVLASWQDPETRARRCRANAEGKRAKMARDPAYREQLRQTGLRIAAMNNTKFRSPEVRARAARTISERAHAWCPIEHREENDYLRSMKIPLAERKEIILRKVPGTVEHARHSIANFDINQRLRAERLKAQEY